MAKRMVDTELWNNEDIIENFTAEDKYFWVYLLTSPHTNICGILKNSPTLIARDMGYHKDTIENLVYRFEKVHKMIITDKETKEILILNWGKFNWTKSQDLAKTVEKQAQTIQSDRIREFVLRKLNEKIGGTVLPPSRDGTNTITINNNTNSVDIHNTLNKQKDSSILVVSIEDINTWFDKVYSIYPRKVSKIQAKNTFTKKIQGMEREEAHRQALAIYQLLERQNEGWKNENNGEGRKLEYIPHFATWLNQNVPDSPNGKGKKK